MKPPEQEAEEIFDLIFKVLSESNDKKRQTKQLAVKYCEGLLSIMPMYTGNLNPKWEHYQKVRAAIEAKT